MAPALCITSGLDRIEPGEISKNTIPCTVLMNLDITLNKNIKATCNVILNSIHSFSAEGNKYVPTHSIFTTVWTSLNNQVQTIVEIRFDRSRLGLRVNEVVDAACGVLSHLP